MSRQDRDAEQAGSGSVRIRLDKWLWAARFFKTRSLAKQAIDGGKVHCNGQRCKSSREVALGDRLELRQGWDERTVVVKALSAQRGGAPQAALLYEETAESKAHREQAAEQRRALKALDPLASIRPSKKDRRQIQRFRERNEG